MSTNMVMVYIAKRENLRNLIYEFDEKYFEFRARGRNKYGIETQSLDEANMLLDVVLCRDELENIYDYSEENVFCMDYVIEGLSIALTYDIYNQGNFECLIGSDYVIFTLDFDNTSNITYIEDNNGILPYILDVYIKSGAIYSWAAEWTHVPAYDVFPTPTIKMPWHYPNSTMIIKKSLIKYLEDINNTEAGDFSFGDYISIVNSDSYFVNVNTSGGGPKDTISDLHSFLQSTLCIEFGELKLN